MPMFQSIQLYQHNFYNVILRLIFIIVLVALDQCNEFKTKTCLLFLNKSGSSKFVSFSLADQIRYTVIVTSYRAYHVSAAGLQWCCYRHAPV